MIGKIFEKGKGSFRNRIEYIFGLSKHEHAITTIQTVGKNCFASDPLRHGHTKDKIDAEGMIQEFDAVEKMRDSAIDSDRVIKPVWHAMLSLKPGESLTEEQWLEAVETYLSDLGFDLENKWVAVLHGDTDHQHVHIVANRICMNEEFTVVRDSNERMRSCDSTSDLEDRFGLSKAPAPTETWGTAISRNALEAAEREGTIPLKHRMIAKIAGAVEACQAQGGDMFLLVQLLRRQRVYVHFTKSQDGQPKGIAYEYNGTIISGRKLKRSRLTFQKLIQQEGISYDPETFPSLEIEAARRDAEREERVRIYYLVIRARNRRSIRLSFQAKKQQELEATIRLIIALLLSLLGIRANWELEDKKYGEPYYQLRSDWMKMPRVEQEQDLAMAWENDPALAL
ncbi:relaxase/mobilization nuclease domain-containing protein [Pseudomonas salomonii]|uniref:Relaxase/Mobilisation nuclease domain-containing protein n=1 Tax=Pseudomonas salomonii TaxID=191391 RepID=A0A1H3IHT4_9PSED|nr:relaxase/mobilization nuclease domain-containing protein [Pseudomonas salomonii]SDY27366.1 Relaxase/Mobilisation nuclease domain-containing protein [Pseudomonas salomonii]